MQVLIFIAVLILSYLIGSIPFGFLIVHLKTGKDIRQVESGRTGGTNVMRAAGYPAGFATGLLDILKGFSVVWLARWWVPGNHWLEVLAPVLVILGHNYSIFLAEYDEKSGFRLRGGAGGAPSFGGVVGLWFPSVFILGPILLLILFGIGYASVATMSIGLLAILLFVIRTLMGASPWQYIFYGVFAEIIVLWALRPNVRRLLNGTERKIGWRTRRNSTKVTHIDSEHTLNQSSSPPSSKNTFSSSGGIGGSPYN